MDEITKKAVSYGIAYYLVAMLTFGFIYNEAEPLYDLCISQNEGRIIACENWSGFGGDVLFFKSAIWPVYATGRVAIWITS